MVKFEHLDTRMYNELDVIEQITMADAASNHYDYAQQLMYESAVRLGYQMLNELGLNLKIAQALGDKQLIDKLELEMYRINSQIQVAKINLG